MESFIIISDSQKLHKSFLSSNPSFHKRFFYKILSLIHSLNSIEPESTIGLKFKQGIGQFISEVVEFESSDLRGLKPLFAFILQIEWSPSGFARVGAFSWWIQSSTSSGKLLISSWFKTVLSCVWWCLMFTDHVYVFRIENERVCCLYSRSESFRSKLVCFDSLIWLLINDFGW